MKCTGYCTTQLIKLTPFTTVFVDDLQDLKNTFFGVGKSPLILASVTNNLQIHIVNYTYKHIPVYANSALHRKFETNIPRNETERPCSQFLHSCICERFICYHDLSTNAIHVKQNRRTDRGNI
jgi:hypothetical protein